MPTRSQNTPNGFGCVTSTGFVPPQHAFVESQYSPVMMQPPGILHTVVPYPMSAHFSVQQVDELP